MAYWNKAMQQSVTNDEIDSKVMPQRLNSSNSNVTMD